MWDRVSPNKPSTRSYKNAKGSAAIVLLDGSLDCYRASSSYRTDRTAVDTVDTAQLSFLALDGVVRQVPFLVCKCAVQNRDIFQAVEAATPRRNQLRGAYQAQPDKETCCDYNSTRTYPCPQ